MCTLVIAWRVLADAPVAVAANRDEALDRSASPPSLIDEDPRVVAPLDEEAGGTWLGYNEHGLLVGLSNRWVDTALDGERSRGLLVRDLLRQESADEAGSALEEAVRDHSYEPFNLVAADAETALVFTWDTVLSVAELSPGVHAVMNAGWDDRFVEVEGRETPVADQYESAHRLRAELAVEPDESAEHWFDRAVAVLADHDLGVCVHGDGYGTRSSSLIGIGSGTAIYRFADGPPCETPFAAVKAQT